MALVRRTVERIIESDPTIRTGLQRGIINSRALTRYILENCAVDATPDAVIGILRRYPIESAKEGSKVAFKDCDIMMRTGMAYLTLENASDVMRRVADFTGSIRSTRGENFRVIVGSNAVRVITHQEAVEKFKETFRPRDIISYWDELAEICLLLPRGAERLGEIATATTSQLTLNNINLVGILVCPPEDVIIVSESDASRTFEALQQLLKEDFRTIDRRMGRVPSGLQKQGAKTPEVFRLDDSVMSPILAF